MDKKLTLNIDENLIQFAHTYSKYTHQSISKIVEKYFQRLKKQIDQAQLSAEAEELYGIFENETLPDKKELRKSSHEKNIG